MSTPKRSTSKRWRANGLFVLVAVVGLVFASAGPAAATHRPVQGGAGATLGWELGPNLDQLCSPVNAFAGLQYETTYYVLTADNANYVVRDHNGNVLAAYAGAVTMDVQHGDMVAAPQGTRPGECDGSTVVPDEIPLTNAWVVDNSATGAVDCSMTAANGYYLRQTASSVTIEFNLECDITGNTVAGSAHNVPVKHTWTGLQFACFQLPGGCSNPDAGSQLTGSYSIQAS